MKKLFLSFGLLSSFIQLMAQTPQDATFTKEEYLKKNKAQKIGAFVLLGGGVALMIIGAATYKVDFTIDFYGNTPTTSVDNTVPTILVVTGILACLGSIPLAISARNNKRKAASIAFSNQQILFAPQQHALVSANLPSVSLRIQF